MTMNAEITTKGIWVYEQRARRSLQRASLWLERNTHGWSPGELFLREDASHSVVCFRRWSTSFGGSGGSSHYEVALMQRMAPVPRFHVSVLAFSQPRKGHAWIPDLVLVRVQQKKCQKSSTAYNKSRSGYLRWSRFGSKGMIAWRIRLHVWRGCWSSKESSRY